MEMSARSGAYVEDESGVARNIAFSQLLATQQALSLHQ